MHQGANMLEITAPSKLRLLTSLWQVTAVVLVLMLGAATTIRDKLRPSKVESEKADIGAPAVTGATLYAAHR